MNYVESKKYFFEIDGIRFYTFLLILANHTGLWKLAGGTSIFFTLSGFLIAFTSVNQIERNGVFCLKRYFKQRVLRTFPLYFLIVLGCGFVYIIAKQLGVSFSFANYWSFIIFLQNFFGFGTIFILSNLWAMAVTEQLYFGWGLLMQVKQKKIINLVLPLALIILIGTFTIRKAIDLHYANTLNYIGIYLLGAYCGVLYFKKGGIYNFFKIQHALTATFFSFLGVLIIAIGLSFSYDNEVLFARILFSSIGLCLLLLSVCYGNIKGKYLLSNKIIRYLGKISYGLYCYHAIVLTLISKYFQYKEIFVSNALVFLITLLITIVVATISYEFFEKKFIMKKLYLDMFNNAKEKHSINKRSVI